MFKSEAGILESGSTEQAEAKLCGVLTELASDEAEMQWLHAHLGPLARGGRIPSGSESRRSPSGQQSCRRSSTSRRAPWACPRTSSAWAGGATEWRRWRDRARSSPRGTTTSPPQDEAPSTCSRAPVRGERIQITTADGAVHTYRVATVASYPKTALPLTVFGRRGPPRLVLVTCGGRFDSATRHFLDNIVVTAVLI